METALLGGLLGILGGIVAGLVVSILSQRKNEAEIKRLEAETRKINTELDSVHHNEYREMLSKIHDHVHIVSGNMMDIARERQWPMLDDKSDEYITAFLENSLFTKFASQQILKAPDKTQTYKEQTIWYEFLQLERSRFELHNYIVEKEIFIDNEDFMKVCEAFDLLTENFVKMVGSDIAFFAKDEIGPSIYRSYESEIDTFIEKIDTFIKTELKRNRH